MDMCISDAEMFQCSNGHTVGNEYRLSVPDLADEAEAGLRAVLDLAETNLAEAVVAYKTLAGGLYTYGPTSDAKDDLKTIISDSADGFEYALHTFKELVEGSNYGYEVNPICCPICQMTTIRDEDLLRYLLKVKLALPRKDIEDEIRSAYTDFDAFQKGLKG